MDINAIHNRVDISEIEMGYGMNINITVDTNARLYHLMFVKRPFYQHHIITEVDLQSMTDEALEICIRNLANEVFTVYYTRIISAEDTSNDLPKM